MYTAISYNTPIALILTIVAVRVPLNNASYPFVWVQHYIKRNILSTQVPTYIVYTTYYTEWFKFQIYVTAFYHIDIHNSEKYMIKKLIDLETSITISWIYT